MEHRDPKGNVTSWTYDERGNKLTHKLPGNQQESWTFDQYNRVVTHTDLNGNTAWEVYANAPQWPGVQGPDAGRLIAEYRYAGSFTPPGVTSPDSTAWAERTVYVYDDGVTDPSTGYQLPSAEQTHLGRVAEVQEWTKSGTTETETDFTHTTYDPITGQPSSITSDEGTINYTYDPVTGNKVRMWTGTDPHNAPDDTDYAYDSQGRLTDVYTLVLDGTRYATFGGIDSTTHNPTYTGTPPDTHYRYDLAGNLKTESQPDQTTTTYTYDDLNRLTDLATQNTSTNEPVFAEHYELYADGSRKDVTDTRYNADATVFSQTKTTWPYDAGGRLTSESLAVLAGGSNAPAAYTDTFKFDLDGNRTEEDISGSQTATVNYTYTSNNQLLTETRTGDGAYATNDGYDNAGNLTSQVRTGTSPETDSYTWDLRGRMSSATVNGTTTTYTYDTGGVRTGETTGTTSTYYLNDPNNPTGYTKAVEESSTKGGTPSRSFIFGLQVEGQADATHGVLFLLHDGHGNTRALLNVSGGVVEQYNNDAYGNLLTSTGAQASAANALTPWLQPDGLYDSASGWNYNLARWRDGFHFASMDPAVFTPGQLADANAYTYVGGNPIDLSDPSGLDSVAEELDVVGIMNKLASTVNRVNAAYQRAKSIYNGIQSVSKILQLATGDLGQLIDDVKSNLSGNIFRQFGKYSWILSEKGLEDATQSLLTNATTIGLAVLQYKSGEITEAYSGSAPALVIKMPTPPFSNPLALIPPIPIGLKLGGQLPVYLSFATRNQRGRFIGLAISPNHEVKHFDSNNDLVELFHMDYKIHSTGALSFSEQQTGNYDAWQSGGFEYQIPR